MNAIFKLTPDLKLKIRSGYHWDIIYGISAVLPPYSIDVCMYV